MLRQKAIGFTPRQFERLAQSRVTRRLLKPPLIAASAVKAIDTRRRQCQRLTETLSQRRSDSDTVIGNFLGPYKLPENEQLAICSPELRADNNTYYSNMRETGRLLLQLESEIFVMTSGSRSDSKIAGLDFDVLATRTMDRHDETSLAMLRPSVLRRFVRFQGLTKCVISSYPISRSRKMSSALQILQLLMGSVCMHHGAETAHHFVRTRVIEGSGGLFEISLNL